MEGDSLKMVLEMSFPLKLELICRQGRVREFDSGEMKIQQATPWEPLPLPALVRSVFMCTVQSNTGVIQGLYPTLCLSGLSHFTCKPTGLDQAVLVVNPGDWELLVMSALPYFSTDNHSVPPTCLSVLGGFLFWGLC
jgi:hypothetical protein